jgi:hypothetical protein
MTSFTAKRSAGFLIMAVVMLATRLCHFEFPPDASWAIFFLAGFYLYSYRAFAVLMVEAVAIDYLATQHMGISSYCLSPAYVLLLPSYAALRLGGRWAGRHWNADLWRGIGCLGASVLVSVSVCFLLSNGSFYWLSGRAAAPSLAGWAANFIRWYPHFLAVPCAYIGLATLSQVTGVHWAHRAHAAAPQVPQY